MVAPWANGVLNRSCPFLRSSALLPSLPRVTGLYIGDGRKEVWSKQQARA